MSKWPMWLLAGCFLACVIIAAVNLSTRSSNAIAMWLAICGLWFLGSEIRQREINAKKGKWDDITLPLFIAAGLAGLVAAYWRGSTSLVVFDLVMLIVGMIGYALFAHDKRPGPEE